MQQKAEKIDAIKAHMKLTEALVQQGAPMQLRRSGCDMRTVEGRGHLKGAGQW